MEVTVLSPFFNYYNRNLLMTHYSKSMNKNDNWRSDQKLHLFSVLFIDSTKRLKNYSALGPNTLKTVIFGRMV
jgi:hypothetical protein